MSCLGNESVHCISVPVRKRNHLGTCNPVVRHSVGTPKYPATKYFITFVSSCLQLAASNVHSGLPSVALFTKLLPYSIACLHNMRSVKCTTYLKPGECFTTRFHIAPRFVKSLVSCLTH